MVQASLKKSNKPKLARKIGLVTLTLYGLGNILGAGIYVLIGKVAGEAGYAAPLAFVVAMVVALFSALSYAELASRYPVSSGVSTYIHNAFKHKSLSLLVGLLMIASGVVSAAAMAQGFAGYAQAFVPLPTAVLALGILMILGGIAARGIGESTGLAAVFTLVEIAGLVLVIWAGRSVLLDGTSFTQTLRVSGLSGINGVMAGAFLAFYAFIGFEDIVNMAEEVKQPRRNMPTAILAALGVATILYILTVIVAVRTIPPAELAASNAPLALVFGRIVNTGAWIVALIGVTAAVNGIIAHIIMGSRMLYGMASRGWLHSHLSRVNARTQTPIVATWVVVGAMMLASLSLPLLSLAKITSFLVLGVFILVNGSLLVIKRQPNYKKAGAAVPAVVPWLGLVTSGGIVLYELFAAWL